MKTLTREQAEKALPHVKTAVESLLKSWDAEREIERALGFDVDDLGQRIADLASMFDDDVELDVDDVLGMFPDFETEEG